ncbi:MAG: hypothetical protein V7644_480 [Actinomycetota bacterium]|jgi:hypothetical protein
MFSSRRAVLVMGVGVAAAILAAGMALAATKPHLKPATVGRIAIRAARPYTQSNGTFPPITVLSTRAVVRRGAIRWLVRLQAQAFLFPCPGGSKGTCPAYLTPYALVRIADATGRVLSVEPLP